MQYEGLEQRPYQHGLVIPLCFIAGRGDRKQGLLFLLSVRTEVWHAWILAGFESSGRSGAYLPD